MNKLPAFLLFLTILSMYHKEADEVAEQLEQNSRQNRFPEEIDVIGVNTFTRVIERLVEKYRFEIEAARVFN